MDVSSIAGTSVMMQAAQTREVVSTSMIKMASDQQQLMVNLLAQNVQSGSKINSGQNDFNFSIYA